MATPDVTIRGAGIFGLSVAWACQSRGARVRVIDPNGPGAGASGGVVGALAPHVPENWNPKKAFQLKSLLAAEGFWAGVDAVSGLSSGYARSGRLQPLVDEAAIALAGARTGTAETLWAGAARWEIRDARSGDGWSPPSPTGRVIWDDLTARLHPRRACESLAAALVVRGGVLDRAGSDEGQVVHASGFEGLRALSAHFERLVGDGVKGQAALIRHSAPKNAPQIFSDGLHIVPHDDGTVAIGSTSERTWDVESAEVEATDALVARAVEALPILHGATVVARWAGIRPRAVTRAPVLGAWPGRPGHFVANGGFKIGFGMAPEVAEVMADLVLEGVDRIPDGFRIEDALAR